MYSVILCGGSGTRLWPLSRQNFPKQFLKLYSKYSLLQETFLRMREIMSVENIYFITNEVNFFNVLNQIREIEKNFKKEQILIEPYSLNTAPAITYTVKFLLENKNLSPLEPIIFLPADHYIGDKQKYIEIIKLAIEEVNNFIGTIGIIPTKPETGFGYIKKGEKIKNFYHVAEFKEKPNKIMAQYYLATEQYVWNSGIYIFNIETFINELKKCSPEIYSYFQKNFQEFIYNFHNLPSISFDCAISEKSNNIIVFEGDFGWSDIGSFDSLADINKNNCDKQISIDSKNVFVYSFSNKLIATLGVEDLIIVENIDSILICKKGYSEDIKKIVECLKNREDKELFHNILVHRPWGKYEVLIEGTNHKVKKIIVYAGEKLSLQAHYHRAEHWVVVKGTAKIIRDKEEIFLRENESIFLPPLTKHRLENPGKINLEIIEVQTGNYIEEDDIIRFEDIYDRA